MAAALISFDEAIGRLREVARPRGQEIVPLAAAAGRVLAEPVCAAIRAPAADVSTMDGYAVGSADVRKLPARLAVVAEALPGTLPGGALGPGQCARIFTGAPLPAGADRVVIQEVVRRAGDRAIVEGPVEESRFVRAAGSDFEPGDVLVGAGRPLTPRDLVAAAAGDVAELIVWRRPVVSLIATGDELVDPGDARSRPGAVPDSLSAGLAVSVLQWGAELGSRARMSDDLDQLKRIASAAAANSDLVLVTGGASVGARDHGREMFGPDLALIFSKVAIKPGKPVWFGRVGEALVLGLPGNPTSAMVTARLFLAPLLAGLCGADPLAALAWRHAPLGEALGPTGNRETFSRGRTEGGRVWLLPNQDSGAQRTLAEADLLARRPSGSSGFAAGGLIEMLDF
jgi:molybdopterin molybdotransferase